MAQQLQLFQVRDPQALLEFLQEDQPPPVVAPAGAGAREYRPLELPRAEFRNVPDRDRNATLLEDLANGTQRIGTALLGIKIKSEDSESSDSDSSDSSDSSDEEVGSKKTHLALAPQLMIAGAGALGVSALARIGRGQYDHERQQAIEANTRIEKETLFKAKLALAEAEFNAENNHRAKKEENQFIIQQIQQRNQLEETRLKVKGEAYAATLEAQVKVLRDQGNAQIEREKIEAERALAFRREERQEEEKKVEISAGLFENAQQLTDKFIQSSEKTVLQLNADRVQQAQSEREYSVELHRETMNTFKLMVETHAFLMREVLRKDDKSKKENQIDSIRPEIREEVKQLKRVVFSHGRSQNECFNGLSVYHLLVEASDLSGLVKNRLIHIFEFLIKRVGADSRKEVLQRLLTKERSHEFFDFILRSISHYPTLKKEAILEDLFMIYSVSFNRLKK